MTDVRTPNEFEIIARYFAPLAAAAPGAKGLLDDAALITARPDHDLVVSTDTMVESVHFPVGETPSVVAARLLAVGFSDIAAMGAGPLAYAVSLTIPRAWSGADMTAWLDGFTEGLAAAQEELGVVLIGGDTVSAQAPLSLTLTAFGEAERGRALHRSGAAVGDGIYVSGTIGDGALGLLVLTGEISLPAVDGDALVARYCRPTARLRLGRSLVGLASAAADVSDGLVADLGHICRASGVTASIEADRVPLSKAARSAIATDPSRWPTVLTGGDDYELVFTAPPGAAGAIAAVAKETGETLAEIGCIEAGVATDENARVRVTGPDGRLMAFHRSGFSHL